MRVSLLESLTENYVLQTGQDHHSNMKTLGNLVGLICHMIS